MKSGAMNAQGLTVKQEFFAQLLARGKNLSDAYRESYSSLGNAATINGSASRLWRRPEIRARVEELCQQQSSLMMRDSVAIRRHVFSRLLAESQDMQNRASERISALLALGKIDSVSMFREVQAVERLGDRPAEEIEEELKAKLSHFLGEAEGLKRSGANLIEDQGASTERDVAAPPPRRRKMALRHQTSEAGDQGANGHDHDH